MLENLFQGIFDAETTTIIGLKDFLLCIVFALILGLLISLVYMYRNKYTQSFVLTIALLPALVCVVIMLVNGNIGTGVAVAGAFSLVRFRSAAGSAKEICMLFLAMAIGLILGMGYLGYAVVFTLIMCACFVVYNILSLKVKKKAAIYKNLTIVIPEDLDYTGVFDDIFQKFTSSYELVRVKSTNMGSMFKLTYEVTLVDVSKEKEMLDQLRCRNGNLEITISSQDTVHDEL